MAAELMLINPRRRRRRSGGRRKMSALQRKYFGKGHGRITRRRRHRRRSVPVTVAASNPRRHRRHRRSAPRSLRIRRVRRNPMPSMGSFTRQLYPAVLGAGGALALDLVLGTMGNSLPAMLTDPTVLPFTRMGLAFGIGYVGGMVNGREFGNQMAAGALTVTIYDLVKSYLVTNTQIPLARYVKLNRYVSLKGLGNRRHHLPGLGYIGPARTAGKLPTPVVQNVRR